MLIFFISSTRPPDQTMKFHNHGQPSHLNHSTQQSQLGHQQSNPSQHHLSSGRFVVDGDCKKQGNLQTITLEDTPSPAVSVITISDSSEEDEETFIAKQAHESCNKVKLYN